MRVELKNLQRRLGITVIYVTHDQIEAMALGDRIAVINGGYLQQIGSPMQLYEKPINTFVAGFIGFPQMNLMEGRIEKTGGKFYFISRNTRIALKPAGDLRIGDCILGVRPSDIEIGDLHNSFSEKVISIELLGKDALIYVSCPDFNLRILTEKVSVKEGDEIKIRFNSNKIHIFPDKD